MRGPFIKFFDADDPAVRAAIVRAVEEQTGVKQRPLIPDDWPVTIRRATLRERLTYALRYWRHPLRWLRDFRARLRFPLCVVVIQPRDDDELDLLQYMLLDLRALRGGAVPLPHGAGSARSAGGGCP
ncbi:MAG: hypothetical protein AAB368_05385 [bacterium]